MDQDKRARQRAYARAYHERMKDDPEYIARRRAVYQKHNAARTPEQIRRYAISSRYKTTPEAITALWESQGCRCAGCLDEVPNPAVTANTGRPRSSWAHIDHCHDSGRVRGILCHKCNVALGHARDSAETLRRLATYLETNP